MSNVMELFNRMGQVFLSGTKVRDLIAMKNYSPKSITCFNAEGIYEDWLTVIVEGNCTSAPQKAERGEVLVLYLKTEFKPSLKTEFSSGFI
jgi:hypothetical protein